MVGGPERGAEQATGRTTACLDRCRRHLKILQEFMTHGWAIPTDQQVTEEREREKERIGSCTSVGHCVIMFHLR